MSFIKFVALFIGNWREKADGLYILRELLIAFLLIIYLYKYHYINTRTCHKIVIYYKYFRLFFTFEIKLCILDIMFQLVYIYVFVTLYFYYWCTSAYFWRYVSTGIYLCIFDAMFQFDLMYIYGTTNKRQLLLMNY